MKPNLNLKGSQTIGCIGAGQVADCGQCPGGKKCPGGAEETEDCAPGYYSKPGSRDCTLCLAGSVLKIVIKI